MSVRSNRIEIVPSDLAAFEKGIKDLEHQLPTHQVNALRQAANALVPAMQRHARPMNYKGNVEKSIGAAETRDVVSGIVTGKAISMAVGPGVGRTMPIHAPLMEEGWRGGWRPNYGRIKAWAQTRIPGITGRQVAYIVRAIERVGAMSPRNPRTKGDKGYYYVQKTYENEGKVALDKLQAQGFKFVASILKEFPG